MSFTFHLVIPNRSGDRILLVEEGDGWGLPRAENSERTLVLDVGRAIWERLGLDVVVLRSVLEADVDPFQGAVFCSTENLTDREPSAGLWTDRDDVEARELADPRDRTAALAWFEEAREPASLRLQPWQREGWFAEASSWIREVVSGVDQIRQFATWCNSCVLRVEASGRVLYFKASPDHFLREADVTVMLDGSFPGAVPHVVELDGSRGWMLLDDLGDAFVSGLPPDDWLHALAAVASLHRRSIPVIDRLLDGGCLDRRPPVLAAQIEALAGDADVALPDGLRPRLQAAVRRLQEMCGDLEASPIPSTLVHGDLHADNILRTDRGYVLFDWTDACVATPFVDLLLFIHKLAPNPDDTVIRRRLRDRYLDAWSDVVPLAHAIEWYELAEPLAAMHQAVTYRGILDAFGPDEWWQFSSALPWWIEKALNAPSLRPH